MYQFLKSMWLYFVMVELLRPWPFIDGLYEESKRFSLQLIAVTVRTNQR